MMLRVSVSVAALLTTKMRQLLKSSAPPPPYNEFTTMGTHLQLPPQWRQLWESLHQLAFEVTTTRKCFGGLPSIGFQWDAVTASNSLQLFFCLPVNCIWRDGEVWNRSGSGQGRGSAYQSSVKPLTQLLILTTPDGLVCSAILHLWVILCGVPSSTTCI